MAPPYRIAILPILLLATTGEFSARAATIQETSSPNASSAPAMLVLNKHCLGCHNPEKRKGGLILTSREEGLEGGEAGPVIVPGKPEASLLLKALEPSADPHMPPKGQLSRAELAVLRTWVMRGAHWDKTALAKARSDIKPVSLESLPASYRPVLGLALSPGGKTLAVARGGSIVLHDASQTNFPAVAQVEAHRDAVQSLAWSPDGRWIASGGFRRIALWDGQTLAPLREISENLLERITALEFSPHGNSLVAADGVASQSGFVRVFDPLTGRPQGSWRAHEDSIFDLELNRDGTQLITAGGDRLVKVWDWKSRSETARLEGHATQVVAAAFNTNASYLVTAGSDKQLKIWDLDTRQTISSLGGQSAGLTALAWTAQDQLIVAATERGVIYTYTEIKTHTGEQSSQSAKEHQIADTRQSVHCLITSSDGNLIFGGTQDGTVHVWDRTGKVLATLESESSERPVTPSEAAAESVPLRAEQASAQSPRPGKKGAPVSFLRDVLPVLSKAGCNAGSCHAKPEGQNGFKLSVFSYDPQSDYREITQDARARRIFPASPEESLILKKPTLAVPHEGGERFKPGSDAYNVVVRWISAGMPYELPGEPILTHISVAPDDGHYRKGAKQRLKVQAFYSDGTRRDVTRLTSFDSHDKEIASVDSAGIIQIGKLAGQGAVVARFMGFMAASKIIVPADRRLADAQYASLPASHFIDSLAYAHFKDLGLFPSPACTDAEFLRRASLDAIGRLPTADEARAFLNDPDPRKRRSLVVRLLDHPAYADYWANKWADLLRPNPDRVGIKSVFTLDQWLRSSFRENKPYDRFVREILLSEGTNDRDGPAVIYRDRRDPPELTTMFSQVFLGTRLECARCHHHPNEKWSQEDFFRFAAFFGPLKRKGAGLSPPISAGAETFYFTPGGPVKHPVTGANMTPRALDSAAAQVADNTDPRLALVDWMTAPDNPFFSRAIVNRVWAALFGRGFVEPVDDFRISNPCANPRLLDALAADFATHAYDLKYLIRTIMDSHLYELSSEPNKFNIGDTRNFSRAYRRRLPAEVLLDAVNDATAVPDTYAGLPPGSRAMHAWSYKIESQFLDAFGRPNSSSDCPCERDARSSVVQSLHLMHSKSLQAKLSHPHGRARSLADSNTSPAKIVTELYLATLTRMPDDHELALATQTYAAPSATRQTATEDVLWALLNSPEFLFNH